MKVTLSAFVVATVVLPAAALSAQTTGVSRPESLDDNITVSAPAAPAAVAASAKPAEPAATPAPVLQVRTEATPAPHPELVADAMPLRADSTLESRFTATPDPDAGIVTAYPAVKNGLSEGTLLRARLNQVLSSRTTVTGSHFTAELTTDVLRDGKVLLPAGATLRGRVTEIRNGHKLGGAASMHLEPESITLPDGNLYRVDARVIDLADDEKNSRVNEEGTIIRSSHAKATFAALGLTTGSAAAAGAVLGGGVGAVVGAGIGAGVGAIWWMRRDREETLAQGTELVFSLDRNLILTPVTAE